MVDRKRLNLSLRKTDLIEEFSSPFAAAPVTLAYFRYVDGNLKKIRLCIDFLALNKIMVLENELLLL